MTIEEMIGAVIDLRLAPLQAQLLRIEARLATIEHLAPPILVSINEAAQRLGVSISTVRRMVKAGTLPSRRFGRSVRIDLHHSRPLREAEVAALAAKTQSR